jgi:hypothetical protein
MYVMYVCVMWCDVCMYVCMYVGNVSDVSNVSDVFIYYMGLDVIGIF